MIYLSKPRVSIESLFGFEREICIAGNVVAKRAIIFESITIARMLENENSGIR